MFIFWGPLAVISHQILAKNLVSLLTIFYSNLILNNVVVIHSGEEEEEEKTSATRLQYKAVNLDLRLFTNLHRWQVNHLDYPGVTV